VSCIEPSSNVSNEGCSTGDDRGCVMEERVPGCMVSSSVSGITHEVCELRDSVTSNNHGVPMLNAKEVMINNIKKALIQKSKMVEALKLKIASLENELDHILS